MIGVSIFACFGALFLSITLRRYHRHNPTAKRVAWLPVCMGLQSLNVALSFLFDYKAVNVPIGILTRSVGGWFFMGCALWYLGLYFGGKINGQPKTP